MSYANALSSQSQAFVDTASCVCAAEYVQKSVWRCRSAGGYITTDSAATPDNTGKWYFAKSSAGAATSTQSIDNTTAYVLGDRAKGVFVPLTAANKLQMSLQDQACTGANDTSATALYYQRFSNLTTEDISQFGCTMLGSLPFPLQTVTSWDANGCNLGFYCPNNNSTSLPVACQPTPTCLAMRLSGGFCFVPNGSLEPQICREGFYCPRGGMSELRCPRGFFCPLGAYQPIKCSPFSLCNEGSFQDREVWPSGLLIVIDLILLTIMGFSKLFRHLKPQKHSSVQKPPPPSMIMKRSATLLNVLQPGRQGYSEIEADLEMTKAAPSSNLKVLRMGTGFDAALRGGNFQYSMMMTDTVTEDERELQLFVQSLRRCLGQSKFGLSFDFDNLSFTPKKSKKPVLSKVTGSINSGSLWGVMGASGAGKSTFVNVLMGRQANTGGTTRVNGVAEKISKYKKIIGYVPQDDIVSPELTVRENILHSARIRLPRSWSDAEIQRHVTTLISCLQLSHITDSIVGSIAKPVISGGQRKRVSIGMELAAAPMALFLDEPTSGLDSTSAASIMTTLKAISRLGITVVTIIHQPRREIFESLDSLVLLGAGKMIYQGLESDVQPYFEAKGFQFPEFDNPADIVSDIIAGQGHLYKPQGECSVASLIQVWAEDNPMASSRPELRSSSPAETAALYTSIKQRGAHWHQQTYYCLLRALLQQYRTKSSIITEITVGMLAGSLLGISQFKTRGRNFRGFFTGDYAVLSSAIDYASIPQISILIGLAIGLTASAPGVRIFGEEKLLCKREIAAGHNASAYYVGKVLSAVPRMVLANLHFTVVYMLLAAIRMSFADAFLANLLYFWCIYGLASVVSMVTRREEGPLIATIASLIVGIFNGAAPSLRDVAAVHMAWFWRLCPGTWLSEAYFTLNVSVWRHLFDVESAAASLGYVLGRWSTDMWVLLAIGTVYRVCAFGGLLLCNRRR